MELTPTTITQVRAFEAVGRLGSFKRAAEELFVTQAALSHHVRHLEEHLGVQLVRRLHRRIELTAEGAQLLAEGGRALEALATALRDLRRSREEALRVSVPPYFSLRWLTPRLGHLWKRHPGLDLQLHHTYQTVDLLRDRVDAAIAWGHGKWPGIQSTLLMTSRLTPICTPEYLRRHGPDLKPADLLGHPLFYEFDAAHWHQWFRAAGAETAARLQGVRIDDSHALRRVVLDGHGFGLFFMELIQGDVAAGRLVQPFDLCIDPGCAYYLNRSRDAPMGAKLQAFTQWILAEAEKDPYV
ncbi:LysR substrate-binding domain-containing protein [Mesoterricola silvestris]|uniref:Transcriptional regulator GcvA n=1 Tax=Mesoterricola silvestris TaxID=2927979 RepID=A0AA48GXQ7_9BACT|nr:LysR substrate-binding domain-containing protein [Mesoterricola silvestris]BDU72283.1 transcriptional regulator GcvA [Mesoterricola silvestris]